LKKEMKMNHSDIIQSSTARINELEDLYGPKGLVFDQAARIATVMLNTHLTAYDISIIVMSLNLAQMQNNPSDPENYISAIVNVAFSAQFATPDDDQEEKLNEGIFEVKKRFSSSEISLVQEKA